MFFWLDFLLWTWNARVELAANDPRREGQSHPGAFCVHYNCWHHPKLNNNMAGHQRDDLFKILQNLTKSLGMSCTQSSFQFSSVQSLNRVWLFETPWIAARQASLSITSSQSSLILRSVESVMPSSHLILCHPLFLLPPIPPSIRVFSNESTLRMRGPKYWSFSFSISPSNEHPGLISFRMDWLDLLAVQGTLKSLLQHHSSKASILWRSAFFTVQLSYPYMTTGKTTALTRWTFVGKVMSLLLNMLSRILLVELVHQPTLGFCWETYNLPVSNFWLIITRSHPSEIKWWKIPVGKASKVLHLTAAVCQLVCPLHPILSPGSMDITRQSQLPAYQMQSQHSQQHVPLSHLSIDLH